MPVGIYKRTKEHCENISKAKKGCKQKPQCGFQKGHGKSNTGRTHFKKGSIPWISGKNHTEKTKQKISLSKKGTPSPRKGAAISKETREKQRKSHIGKMCGSDHWNWKGGISKGGRGRAENERNAEGFHTIYEWELLKRQYGYKCPCCNMKEPEIKLTKDHIIPLSKGGSNYIENIQPLCKSCNCKKYTKIIKYKFDYD